MARKLSLTSTVMIGIASVLIAVSIFFPWWQMKFFAPQYPEGLDIIVYPYKLDGKYDIVNGLNHYVGMAPFSEETFPELQFLPWVIGGMAVLTLVVAILRKKSLLYGIVGLFGVGGILGLYDINRWLKAFGTNLDPKAPIKIDPFIPPMIGENTIANFVTHSYFTYGSFLIGAAFLLLVIPLWRERNQ
ncbi:hypothetical protein [Brevibacillus sp. SYSU BS000544]|uniref:hypothetical protein n=1 Tax=Brevibacillus sp. SYSU BS000544 TaxID=3416443 RepID=UPI003CE54093